MYFNNPFHLYNYQRHSDSSRTRKTRNSFLFTYEDTVNMFQLLGIIQPGGWSCPSSSKTRRSEPRDEETHLIGVSDNLPPPPPPSLQGTLHGHGWLEGMGAGEGQFPGPTVEVHQARALRISLSPPQEGKLGKKWPEDNRLTDLDKHVQTHLV